MDKPITNKELQQKEASIEVCPISSTPKDEMIEHFHKESEQYKKESVYPFSKYAAQYYSDVCVGNCEECKKWEERTEKEVYMRKNNNLFNRLKYELENLLFNFLISLPFTLFVALLIYNNALMSIQLSVAIAIAYKVLDEIVGFDPQSFRSWLDERYEKQRKR